MKLFKIIVNLITLALCLTFSCKGSNNPGVFEIDDFEPEISVKYGDVEVMNGENFLPDSAMDINKPFEIVFTVENSGKANLLLTGSPLVSINGSSLYSITKEPSNTLKTGESTTFTITFEPSEWGRFPITVSIPNNDSDEGNMSFILEGATTYQWARTLGDTDSEELTYKMEIDSKGNLLLAGEFTDAMDFDIGASEDIKISNGSRDIFVMKINSDGSYGWSATMGDSNWDKARGLAVDTSDNVFITGSFRGSVDFNPTSEEDIRTTATGKYDTFLTKFKSNGEYEWTLIFGGPDTDNSEGVALATDAEGNIFVTGWFRGTVDFDPDSSNTDSRESFGESDIFVTKIKSDGSYGWTVTAGDSYNDHPETITIDSNSNIITAGSFQGTTDFSPGPGEDMKTSKGDKDFFFWKIDKDGNNLWSRTIGSVYEDLYRGVTRVDKDNNIYFPSKFGYKMDFDPTEGIDERTRHNTGGFDSFLLKLHADGSYGWTKIIQTSSSDLTFMTFDASGSILLTDRFTGTVDFNPHPDEEDLKTSTDHEPDIFITKLNQDGSYNRTIVLDGIGFDYSRDIATDSFGNIFLNGMFETIIDLNPGEAEDIRTPEGSFDMFILKIIL